jgi:hypothetical protein
MKIFNKLTLLISICLLIVALQLNVHTQAVNSRGNLPTGRERILLGVKLRPRLVDLLLEVERLFGNKEVQARFGRVRESREFVDRVGTTEITKDGTPIIKIDDSINPKDELRIERIVAQELLHLRFRGQRFPLFSFNGSSGLMNQYNFYLTTARHAIRNGIEHWMFAADMRRMGFDASAELKRGFDILKQQTRPGYGDNTLLALNYFRALLEYEDPKLLAEMRLFYLDHHWEKMIESGEKLAALVLEAKPRKPDEVKATFLQCLNALLGKSLRFSLLEPVNETYGAYVQPVVVIRLYSIAGT